MATTQIINTTDPERDFGLYTNNEGASLPADAVVALENVAATVDGYHIVQPNSGGLGLVVGVLDASVADQVAQYVQQYGYRASSIVFVTDTSQSTGVRLVPTTAANYLASTTGGNVGNGDWFTLLQSIASSSASTTTSVKILIRCK